MAASPTIETKRLRLRVWSESDLDAFAAMQADPEVALYTTADGRPQTREQSWRTLTMMAGHWSLKGFGMFAVEETASGRLIGRAGPWRSELWAGVEIGWSLARDAWGRGYATEAARAAGDWAFATLGIEEMFSLIHVDNVRSQSVAQRLGERPRTATLFAGQPHTIWAASRAQWGG